MEKSCFSYFFIDKLFYDYAKGFCLFLQSFLFCLGKIFFFAFLLKIFVKGGKFSFFNEIGRLFVQFGYLYGEGKFNFKALNPASNKTLKLTKLKGF